MSLQSEEFVDHRRTKQEVVTESHQTGGKPVQSHGLGGTRQTGVRASVLTIGQQNHLISYQMM